MTVFVYEYTCARGGFADLQAEGRAMLRAVSADLAAIPGVAVATLPEAAPFGSGGSLGLATGEGTRDYTGRIPASRGGQASRLPHGRVAPPDEETAFRDYARQADLTIVIAPELDHLLTTRCQWAIEAGGTLLGPALAALRLTADKQALAEHWQAQGVPTPPANAIATANEVRYPRVLKPRFGAGAMGTFKIETPQHWTAALEQANLEMPATEWTVQPFVPGLAASVAWLIGPGGMIDLAPCQQHVTAGPRLCYQGGSLPLPAHLAERAVVLSRRAVACVPGLAGWVGVDLILAPDEHGGDDVAIEINPRLTTSYLGLRRLATSNLADLMLRVALAEAPSAPGWKSGPLAFSKDGTVTT